MSQDHYNALPEGHQLNEYTIKAVLGHGGFGITYLAWDENLNKDVAIKEYLPTEFAVRSGDHTVGPRSPKDDEDYTWGLDRFMTEAQTLALFRHPSIVPVYRFFKAHGTAYMVMEYQEGESFSALMRKHRGELTETDLMGLVQPMLDGLAEVHRAGFLHRDVKPGNIYIRRDGSPVLLDFGAARSAVGRKSQNLTSIVTPGYAPLEQYFADGNQGPWTDIYALAAILYQCIAGKLPPEAPARVKKDPITPISEIGAGKFSEHFLAAIDRALMVEEEHRPQTTTDWRDMLLGRLPAFAGGVTAKQEQEADQTMFAGGASILAGGGAAAMAAGGAAAGGAAPVQRSPVQQSPVQQAPVQQAPAQQLPLQQAQQAPPRRQATESLSVGDPVTHTRPGKSGAALKYVAIGVAALFLVGLSAAAAYYVLKDEGGLGIFTGKDSEEAKRKAAEEKRREAEAARKRAEDAALKAAEEKRRKEEATRRAEEEARKSRERDSSRDADRRAAEERRKREAAEGRRKAEEEKRRRAAADKKRAEEEARRNAESESARRKREAEEARRREDEARRRGEAERRRQEEDRRKKEEKRRELASRPKGVSCAQSLAGLNGRYKNEIDCYFVRRLFQSALNSGVGGSTSRWSNSRTGARGTLTVIATIRMANNTFCRRFRQTLTVDGRTHSATGVACLNSGTWRIRN